MTLKRPTAFIWITLAAAWFFDFLFWEKVPGISITLFIFTLLAAGFTLARLQGITPNKNTLWLLLPIGYFAIMTAFRLEPLTTFLNLTGAFLLMAVLARSFLGGQWWLYSFKEYIVGLFSVAIDPIVRPIAVYSNQRSREDAPPKPTTRWRTLFAVLRGLLIALPIVLILASLLSEADPIFQENFENFLDIFDIDNLGEYLFRAVYISILAYLISGVFLHAFYKNHDEDITGQEASWLPRFLGFTESAIILGSVNLLFLAFVAIQLQYFFGGQANISAAGYTYAEYARRGFSELVIVAVISLFLFLGLSSIAKRENPAKQKVFSGLGIALVVQVGIILVSSFQRLQLYEQAYGFTRLRTYTHVFILWLGLLLAAVVALELVKRQRHFALSALLVCIGFVVSLNSLNVDAFIARQNVLRVQPEEPVDDGRGWIQTIEPIDVGYLASLSEDVVPVLSQLYDQAVQSGDTPLQESLAGALACHAALNQNYDYRDSSIRNYTWQSFHFSRAAAQDDWTQLNRGAAFADLFKVYYRDDGQSPWESYVVVNGEEIDCWTSWGWD